MSARWHFFLIGRQQPQAENKSRVALDVGGTLRGNSRSP